MDKNARILIIYNPASTRGKANLRALRLAKQLARKKYTNVTVVATQHAEHAEELAYEEALEFNQTLIVSVGGDGSYNEVINGIVKAKSKNPKSQAVCAILAAGNANDHNRATVKRPLIKAIVDGKPEPIDILELSFGKNKRFAHSYIGIGITGEAVSELNQESLTRWKEIKIITRNFLNVKPFIMIDKNGKSKTYDSVVFANIHRMSKVIRLNDKTSLNDGLFNMANIEHRNRLKFLFTIIRLIVFGGKDFPRLSEYTFSLKEPQVGQLDGEVIALPSKTDIKVSINHELIRTIR